MMKIKTIFILILIVGILLSGCAREKPTKVEKLTLGVETSFLTAPVWVAENRGYFQDEGLTVEIKDFDSGKTALTTMLDAGNTQDLDIITVAQTPVMFNSFTRDDYQIIAAMVTSEDDVKVLIKKQNEISVATDLRGKKIGITEASTGQFFLSLFLSYNGIAYSEVEVVDTRPADLPQALADGKVDAIVTWEPHILNAQKLLGENALILPSEGIYREDFYFVGHREFISNNAEALKGFIRAIERAENFISSNKDDSIDIVADRLGIERSFVVSFWDTFDFQLLLDQMILINLEDEAKWAIENKLTDATEIPNYADYIYVDALVGVKPEAVGIIT
jgi:ABC-type nitrate/sulfonate/bicarbonate transport system substrate-binding protein